jgi:hypothetical protein
MLYREIIAVCSQIHTKHINTLCGQNVELLNVKLAVHIVTTGLGTVKITSNSPAITGYERRHVGQRPHSTNTALSLHRPR